MDVALWDDRIAVNVRHHFFAAQAVAPMMRDAGGGSIINLGSISAHIDLMDLPGYITAKAGIEGLTRTLAREFGPWQIRVNCIIPGLDHDREAARPMGDAGGRGIHRPEPVPAATSSTPTTWPGWCSGSPPTTPARARRRTGSWTEAGCDQRRPSIHRALHRSTARGRSGTRRTAGCCWWTCSPGPWWRSPPTARPAATSWAGSPPRFGPAAAAATCSPPRTRFLLLGRTYARAEPSCPGLRPTRRSG